MKPRGTRVAALFAAAVCTLAVGFALTAQPPPSIKRTVVFKTDMAIPDREGIMVMVDLPVGSAEGKHTHMAEVFAFVLEGTVSLENEGSPKTTLKAGDTFHIAPGKIHEAVNTGTVPAKLAVVFVAEKGKPLTTPVK
ncbi:MAG TPA: cupin domain-containing protein [Thermoanaerobaculia bacterium]|jgi:quercetin dioxygenase-like cupin family protein